MAKSGEPTIPSEKNRTFIGHIGHYLGNSVNLRREHATNTPFGGQKMNLF